MKKRNCMIDSLKFVFAWIVALGHFYSGSSEYFVGSYYAVEFFLLAASVFFFAKLEKPLNNETAASFLRRRFLRFFPWTFSALLACVAARGIILPFSGFGELLDYLSDNLSEIFLIKMNGIVTMSGFINLPTWTVSSMLIIEFVQYYCYNRWRDVFTQFVAPLSVIVGLGIWANLTGTAGIDRWIGIMAHGTFRVWIAYCVGYYCFLLSGKWSAVPLNRGGRITFTCIECMCYAFSIWAMMERTGRLYQWSVMFALAIGIAVSVSGHSLLDYALDSRERLRKICMFLGEISFSVFLTHSPLVVFFRYLFPEQEVCYAYKFHFIFLVLACSLVQWYVVPRCIRVAQKAWLWFKKNVVIRSN